MSFFTVSLRLFAGVVLFASGLGKALQPHQNFQNTLQAYDLVPAVAEKSIAISLPWVELFCGLFLILGLWLRPTLWVASMLFASFCVALAQGLWRGVDLASCGCFGTSLQISPQYMLVFDVAMLAGILTCLAFSDRTSRFSLDGLFG